jgi:hypothetical protein
MEMQIGGADPACGKAHAAKRWRNVEVCQFLEACGPRGHALRLLELLPLPTATLSCDGDDDMAAANRFGCHGEGRGRGG